MMITGHTEVSKDGTVGIDGTEEVLSLLDGDDLPMLGDGTVGIAGTIHGITDGIMVGITASTLGILGVVADLETLLTTVHQAGELATLTQL